MADLKVSIIIPLYNGAAEIGTTLHALATQTYKNFEVFVVDDGSKDDAASAVAAIGDPRVTYLRQEKVFIFWIIDPCFIFEHFR